MAYVILQGVQQACEVIHLYRDDNSGMSTLYLSGIWSDGYGIIFYPRVAPVSDPNRDGTGQVFFTIHR
jgi:hypothetical protein